MAAILDFQSTCHPDAFYYVFESIGLSAQEKKCKIDFQDNGHGGYLGFPIRIILPTFDLQITVMLIPTKFQVSWPLHSGKEVKNKFSRWWTSWISIWNNYCCFWSTSDHDAFYQVSSQLAKGCRKRRLLKQIIDAASRTMDKAQWTTDTDHSRQLMCSGELIKASQIPSFWN